MTIRSGVQRRVSAGTGAILCTAALCLIGAIPGRCDVDTPQVTGHLSRSEASPIKLEVPVLVNGKEFACGKIPGVPIPNPTPFPFAIRLGGLLSPTGKLDAGVDVTIPGHLIASLDTRLDGDVIFGANIGGSNTIIPVTIDQLWSKSLPGNSNFYLGAGAGLYFGGKTRVGGKIVLGGTINKLGVEGNVLFSGTGDPLFLLVGRIGL